MSQLTIDRFDGYFEALHGYPPYDWQSQLAERVSRGDWPSAIGLPTGSGKTACIDIAVFAMACQASDVPNKRTAPRRVFFCVNRRVIVDEAHQRAKHIAMKILEAERNGAKDCVVLRDVAVALRSISGTNADHETPPLDVLELRGGIYRDNRWARSTTQPTIVCTTIDQLGSRLLFRGYGVSSNAAPIQAALIAYDSLILLDEAHISRPFLQTLQQVRRYLDPKKWAERSINISPVEIVPMTATLPEGVEDKDVIPLTDKDRENTSLDNRLKAGKPATLRGVKVIEEAAVEEAGRLADGTPKAVGIIVNRVPTAKAIYKKLRQKHPETDVELVIGSMRPYDRDEQAKRLVSRVGNKRPDVTKRTSFVVATQCLEVGADYDFDALITECASLDALRQRFGRLNRGGRKIRAESVILIDKKQVKPDGKLKDDKHPDPIYGNAMARTWNWLSEHATVTLASEDNSETETGKRKRSKKKTALAEIRRVDFGIDAFDSLLAKHVKKSRIPTDLLAPSASLNAPVMLPAYVDFWCQTAPRPVPDPDVSLFIHGVQRAGGDVQVCWRADLDDKVMQSENDWCDVVALLPPTAAECMSVPISRVRSWLTETTETLSAQSDLLGIAELPNDHEKQRKNSRTTKQLRQRGVLWRGVNESTLLKSPNDLHPGCTLVLPASAEGWKKLGHIPESNEPTATSDEDLAEYDVAESAFQQSRDCYVLRLHPALKSNFPQPEQSAIKKLFERVADIDEPPTAKELSELLEEAADVMDEGNDQLEQKLRTLANEKDGPIRHAYPDKRGVVLTARSRLKKNEWFLPPLDDGDDEPSRTQRKDPVTLTDHTRHVGQAMESALSLLPIADFAEIFRSAVQLHDLGKADERFQALLRNSDRTEAWLRTGTTPVLLAKSSGLSPTRSDAETARCRADLPKGFRHEMLSVQLAECSDLLSDEAQLRDLILHLVAAHHGHARPFAPVVIDEDPPDVTVDGISITTDDRRSSPPHRLDSGIPERFWSLTQRFGWWGLAYLEALLRLADQQASADEDAGVFANQPNSQSVEVTA